MEAFLVKFLPSLFIIVLMMSSIVAGRRENKNGKRKKPIFVQFKVAREYLFDWGVSFLKRRF